jgi:hypothetical protein
MALWTNSIKFCPMKKEIIMKAGTILKLVLMLCLALPLRAQLNGDIELNLSENSLIESNFYYGSEFLRTKAFTFVDYALENDGYFGKTYLNTNIAYGLGTEIQLYHINKPFSFAGAGLTFTIPTDKFYAYLGLLPLWLDDAGSLMKNNVTTVYLFTISLPKNLNFLAFGQFNLAAEGGPAWEYGELDLALKLGKEQKWEIAYNPSLNSSGELLPDYVNRLAVRRKF